MIQFLRKIRKRLIQNNKVTGYILYAIGEIALVVIGILIALQIGNWNTDRKNQRLENSYYCRLLEDVQEDKALIERLIKASDQRLLGANMMLNALQKSDINVVDVMNYNLEAISLITSTFKPHQAAFEDLKSSGNLNLLHDNQIKVKIINYYSALEGMVDVVDINADGAVGLFYDKEDYAQAMWQKINLINTGFDSSLVSLDKLDPKDFSLEKFTKRMTSDAIFYTSTNTRIRYLYISLIPKVEEMILSLKEKCVK